jgi:hypothetical protein
MKKILAFFAVLCIFITSIFVIWRYDTPSHTRDWVDYLAFQALATTTTEDSSIVTLSKVRDWTYDENDIIVERNWISDYTFNTNDVVGVWFMVDRFGEVPVVGHSYITFEFAGGEALSFSIEARREWGEDYSMFQGMLNRYELAYTWSTERDMITRRVLKDNADLFMYKLTLTPEQAKTLLIATLAETNKIATQPQFYNTLTANCTNLLAKIVNNNTSTKLPYHISWNLPGLSDEYLMKHNYINVVDGDIPKAKRDAALQNIRTHIHYIKHDSRPEFTSSLRQALVEQSSSSL